MLLECIPVLVPFSGGLTLFSDGNNLPDVRLLINMCTFMGNKASSGGGVSVLSVHNNARIHITKPMFLENTAMENGGGIYIANERINLSISETVFRANSAKYGGATFTLHSELSFDKCTFIGNEARYGAAINSYYDNAEISNCTFIHNTCINRKLYNKIEETGTIHVGVGNFF